ncbi:MAG: fibronectin type III domain-containing protein, partial [Thaumarchaeota archaeon]|nr:fibronectin type III domain-containing protein [Nitrososphaerota archaeon]
AIAAANTSAQPLLPFDQVLFFKTYIIPKLITDGYRLTVADSVKLGNITIVNGGDGSPSSSYYQPIFSAAGQPTDPVTGSSSYYTESGTITKFSIIMSGDSQVSFDATLDFMVGNVVSLYEANTPSSPQNFASTAGAGGSHTINLSWKDPIDSAGGLTGYKVYRKVWNGFYAPIATLGIVTSYSDNTCTTGTFYYYIITALSSGGVGIPSNEISRVAP